MSRQTKTGNQIVEDQQTRAQDLETKSETNKLINYDGVRGCTVLRDYDRQNSRLMNGSEEEDE